ncbi:CYTH domain-containing protein [Actinomadura spongiicola]|uniref:CYTH domain-containing protein n=1 Tax=Actinomadura spongiicola TaxID=2303421 RepID=A0A372GLT1_9ACTN|nr:CYTH domain-containing protein [Actinomadura spongiicola]RFS86346.1 CYTH domain-containing protein [Actinomadura spongiicola]
MTDIEHEARVLAIDPARVAGLIIAKGGRRTVPDRLMRRYVYDITPGDNTRWIRLRDTGAEVTLTVKEIIDDSVSGTRETEVAVSDFERTNAILGLLGYRPKSYQENRRESFVLDRARLEIDHWPLIPPYLEIEADTEGDVLRVAALLGFNANDLTGENTIKIYRRYGYDLNEIPELRFRTGQGDTTPAGTPGR